MDALTNVRCLSCKQAGKVSINAEYIGYSATCDCYDGAPVHSGDSGPSAPHGMTRAEALQAWIDANECEGCKDGCDSCYPWRCTDCQDDDKANQDCDQTARCEPCAEDNRKYLAMQKRRDDLEAASDYEYDRMKDDRR